VIGEESRDLSPAPRPVGRNRAAFRRQPQTSRCAWASSGERRGCSGRSHRRDEAPRVAIERPTKTFRPVRRRGARSRAGSADPRFELSLACARLRGSLPRVPGDHEIQVRLVVEDGPLGVAAIHPFQEGRLSRSRTISFHVGTGPHRRPDGDGNEFRGRSPGPAASGWRRHGLKALFQQRRGDGPRLPRPVRSGFPSRAARSRACQRLVIHGRPAHGASFSTGRIFE
jgi:hypothetical protein